MISARVDLQIDIDFDRFVARAGTIVGHLEKPSFSPIDIIDDAAIEKLRRSFASSAARGTSLLSFNVARARQVLSASASIALDDIKNLHLIRFRDNLLEFAPFCEVAVTEERNQLVIEGKPSSLGPCAPDVRDRPRIRVGIETHQPWRETNADSRDDRHLVWAYTAGAEPNIRIVYELA